MIHPTVKNTSTATVSVYPTENGSLRTKAMSLIAYNSGSWKLYNQIYSQIAHASTDPKFSLDRLGVQALSTLKSPSATQGFISREEWAWFLALQLPWINNLFVESNWISLLTLSPWAKSREEWRDPLAYAESRNASCPHLPRVIFTVNPRDCINAPINKTLVSRLSTERATHACLWSTHQSSSLNGELWGQSCNSLAAFECGCSREPAYPENVPLADLQWKEPEKKRWVPFPTIR